MAGGRCAGFRRYQDPDRVFGRPISTSYYTNNLRGTIFRKNFEMHIFSVLLLDVHAACYLLGNVVVLGSTVLQDQEAWLSNFDADVHRCRRRRRNAVGNIG